MKKLFIGIAVALILVLLAAWLVGSAFFFDSPSAQHPVDVERPKENTTQTKARENNGQILFGDLHVHTSYSIDAAIFSTPISKGTPRTTPADACDYARFCSGLDFWSINDHAEGMTPWQWSQTREAVRECNAATDPNNPDLVSFLGWEWTQGNNSINKHYGHKNVIFLDQKENEVPTRPIGSGEKSIWRMLSDIPSVVRGLAILAGARMDVSEYGALAKHLQTLNEVPLCGDDKVRDLPDGCYESAATPTKLFSKLDEWGFEAMVIPHGLSWSTTNPLGADFKYQLGELSNKYQNLLEVYSGHGNSEVFRDLPVVLPGSKTCPEPGPEFTACCWQAGTIIENRCLANGSSAEECTERATDTRSRYLLAMNGQAGASPHRTVVPDAAPDDWGQCDQLINAFQPAHNYQPKQSAQYILSLRDNGQQFTPGFIGSSDNHTARPGSSYKESARYYITDTKAKEGDVGKSNPAADRPVEPARFTFEDSEDAANGFFYSGGLVAVHATEQNRQSIWNALKSKQVYGTSGPRIKLWFDLVDTNNVRHNMGSEVSLSVTPTFKVKAAGSLKQRPGCPDYVVDALGQERMESLCRSECYHPGNELHRIDRIEVVRVLPQNSAAEKPQDLIQDPWRTFACGSDTECEVEFSDEEFTAGNRDAIYYVRALQEPTDAIQGDPFHCDRDDKGQCLKTNYCIGVALDDDCLAPVQQRAWSSPIYVRAMSAQE